MRLIAGSGRSGTTWVQDVLAEANHLRPVFEPLHPYVSEIGDRYAYRAFSREDDVPELERFLADACAGRRHSLWMRYRQQRFWLLPSRAQIRKPQELRRTVRRWSRFLSDVPRLAAAGRRVDPIVKCIRANLMLDWIAARFGRRMVFVVRHPGAVIESELRGGWNASFALKRFRNDSRLHEITEGRYLPLLNARLDALEALATRWIVENQWVVEWARAAGIAVVHYEHLRLHPGRQWLEILGALELENAPPPRLIARPSQQSARKVLADDETALAAPRWRTALSDDQLTSIQRVLDAVGCDFYSMFDPAPRISNLASIADGEAARS